MSRQRDIKVTIKTLDGEKNYNFIALKRKDAAEVFHSTLITIVSAIAEISKAKNDSDRTAAIFRAVKLLDFDTFWSLAEKLLKFVVIDDVEIKDINETDYFEENPEELYLAVFHAILENYPKVFIKLREKLKDLDLPGEIKNLGI